MDALLKGLDFTVAPCDIPSVALMSGVECAIRKLPQEEAEDIRYSTTQILEKATLPRPNLPKPVCVALGQSKRKKNIIILLADKGNTTVVMDKAECHSKINSLLQEGPLKKLKKDPTAAVQKETIKLVKKEGIPQETLWKIITKAPLSLRQYGLPKIHKEIFH